MSTCPNSIVPNLSNDFLWLETVNGILKKNNFLDSVYVHWTQKHSFQKVINDPKLKQYSPTTRLAFAKFKSNLSKSQAAKRSAGGDSTSITVAVPPPPPPSHSNDESTRSGNWPIFFCSPFEKKIIHLPGGQIAPLLTSIADLMPGQGNTFLFFWSLQLPCLCIGHLRDFLN